MNNINNMKKIYRIMALVVFLLPISVFAAAVQNQKMYSTTINNQYRIEGYFSGNMANGSNISPNSKTLDFSGLTDGTMTFKATDLRGLNNNINVGVVDGNKIVVAGKNEVTVSVDSLKNASSPTIRATADATSQGDFSYEALDYSYPINVADKTSNTNTNNTNTTNNSNRNFLDIISPNKNSPSPSGSSSSGSSGTSSADSTGATSTSSGSNKNLVPCDGVDCTIGQIKTMGVRIYNYLTGFGAVLAVGAIVWGGFSYITAQGEPSQMAAAKQTIIYAIIGIVVLAASALVVNTVINWIGGGEGKTIVPTVEKAGEANSN